jgi:hypothetical protein
VTDKATAEVAEMVLSGAINKELVSWIGKAGGKAVGISGKDGAMVTARKVVAQKMGKAIEDPEGGEALVVDLGFVGEPETIDTSVLETLSRAGLIPVIAPIAVGPDGETYNINADTMAGSIAAAIGAAPVPADRRARRAGQGQEPPHRPDPQRHPRAGAGRHHQRRHDPQAADLHAGGGSGLRGGGRARWPRAACYAAGVLHLARGGNADSQGLRD